MNFRIFVFITIILIKLSIAKSYSQNEDYFAMMEDSLRNISLKIPTLEHDFERFSINEDFKRMLFKTLQADNSFDYPFDSLTTVSFLTAPDNSFRIITWYIPLPKGDFEYFGFFQVKDERRGDIVIYPLMNMERVPDDIGYIQLSPDNWYGAYYYKLIHTRHNREDYYTLLGWRGDNPVTRIRIIETLRIAGRGRPVFGVPLFTYKDNRLRRVIFEYSSKSSMHLDYDRQSLRGRRRPVNMIVFDRLAPSHPNLSKHPQFYFPETNIVDAFVFEDGRWVYYPEIDARNPRN